MEDDKLFMAAIVFTVIVFVSLILVLGWSLQHSSDPYIKPCILAGYDTAEWQLFASEPVCIKRTPLSQVDRVISP